jgi:hypothetical protein
MRLALGSEPVTSEKRAHPRMPTVERGRLLSLDGRCNYDCAIVDVSEGGARIRVREIGLVPSRVYLYVTSSSEIFDCEVRWRGDGEVGLRFSDVVLSSTRRRLLALCTPAASP